jgi:hypothetical protein
MGSFVGRTQTVNGVIDYEDLTLVYHRPRTLARAVP